MSSWTSTLVPERVTRAGWLAKGLLFVIIGLLALQVARGSGAGGEDADQRGALANLVQQPFGRVLVLVVSIGLGLFALWQIASALLSDEVDVLDVLKRVGSFGLGLAYGLLAVTAFRIAVKGRADRSAGDESASSPDEISARLLDWPLGPWLVAAVGIGTLAVAGYHLQKGLRREFLDDIDTGDLDERERAGLTALGLAGFTARAIALAVVGLLFVDAAIGRDPEKAAGLDDALRSLREAPWGAALLWVTAIGLFCAGVYDMVTFRRQRLD
ncbi:MAG: DUF1206 domain-containing protein [Acidimicrobiales bacterium]